METNEKLGEILQLCLQLQASGWGDVMYSIEGHVSGLTVQGYKFGYKDGSITFTYRSYFDGTLKDRTDKWTITVDNMIENLKALGNDQN